MSTPDPDTLGAAPWYSSPVQISQITAAVSGVLTVFPQLANLIGLTDSTKITAAVTVAAAVAGAVFRARSKIQPLTLTKAKANSHPATVVADARANASNVPPTA